MSSHVGDRMLVIALLALSWSEHGLALLPPAVTPGRISAGLPLPFAVSSPRTALAGRRRHGACRPSSVALRAGLADAVKGLWPFKGKANEEDQYLDRKDVWDSLVMLNKVTGGELQVMVNALTATGLCTDLSADGEGKKTRGAPVTLFAALNSAFERLPPECLLADCVAAVMDESTEPSPALLEELRASLQGSIADGRYSIDALEGKQTAITSWSGRSANLDLLPGSSSADFTDYVLDMELRRKVKVCQAVALVSMDVQCSNGVIHIVDKLPDGSVPIVRMKTAAVAAPAARLAAPAAAAAPAPTLAEADQLQKALSNARTRKAELEAELACLSPLLEEKKLTRASVKELVDTYLRQGADFDNYKKRADKDMVKVADSSATMVLESLLPVLDVFEMAQQGLVPQTPGEAEIQEAYQAVNRELLDTLESVGVQAVEAFGRDFDARDHEAVQMQESDEFADQVVCRQYQRGYRVGGRLVRPAMVVVSSGPGPVTDETKTTAAQDDGAPAHGDVGGGGETDAGVSGDSYAQRPCDLGRDAKGEQLSQGGRSTET